MNATRDGWQQVTPHVFADRDEDLREDQMRMAGVLEAGPGAALAGCSAQGFPARCSIARAALDASSWARSDYRKGSRGRQPRHDLRARR